MAHRVLVVGATRGLGASFVKKYASGGSYAIGTARSEKTPEASKNEEYIANIDISKQDAGSTLAKGLNGKKIDTAIITAGYFGLESFDEPDWDAEMKMYTISSIGPVFIVHHLVKSGLLEKGAKIILISSESGSITLRHETEGGGNYAHHASKTALNMVGKLLSLDLKDKEIAVGMIHPGFMRTEMTKGVGFDKFWDEAGAKTPDQAAEMIMKFIETFDMKKTGTFWAPGGAKDIGTAEAVFGSTDKLPTPWQIPW